MAGTKTSPGGAGKEEREKWHLVLMVSPEGDNIGVKVLDGNEWQYVGSVNYIDIKSLVLDVRKKKRKLTRGEWAEIAARYGLSSPVRG